MIADGAVLQFTWVTVALVVSPGPTLAVVLRNALADGSRAGLAAALGIGSANALQGVVAAFGLAALFRHAPVIRAAVEIGGGGYLLWLGIRSIVAAVRGTARRAPADSGPSHVRGFREGLLTNLLHPAVTIFYITVVPAFIAPGRAVLPRFALLATIHVVVSTSWMAGCALLVGHAARILARPAVLRGLQCASGAVLVGFGLVTAVSPR